MVCFLYSPYVSVGTIKFGMTNEEVDKMQGKADSISVDGKGEVEEDRGNISIRYDDEGVAEIAFSSGCFLEYDGCNLNKLDNLVQFLMKRDRKPFECLGFLIFKGLGLAISGYHDGDDEQKAITAFKRGRWDSMTEYFSEYVEG